MHMMINHKHKTVPLLSCSKIVEDVWLLYSICMQDGLSNYPSPVFSPQKMSLVQFKPKCFPRYSVMDIFQMKLKVEGSAKSW